jgi:Tol biopolymer transport system component
MQFKKSATIKKILLLNAVAIFICSCQSSPTRVGADLPTPKGYKEPAMTQLSSDGENYGAQFSPDGKSLLFIAAKKIKHSHAQIYQLNLSDKTARRITFQDGDIFDVSFQRQSNNNDSIVYSSSTDELKENPAYIQQAVDKMRNVQNLAVVARSQFDEDYLGTEIYTSSINGRNIERHTDEVGFDGQACARPKSHEIAYVSLKDNLKQIRILNTLTGNTSPIAKSQTEKRNDEYPAYSPDGKKLAWSRKSIDGSNTEIWLGDAYGANAKAIISNMGHNLEPAWHPNGEEIIFTSNRDAIPQDSKNYEIYIAKIDGTCQRRLTYHSAIDRSPEISIDGRQIVFTSLRSGKKQIYLTELNPPPCPDMTPAVQSAGDKK